MTENVSIAIGLVGPGAVGRALLEQLRVEVSGSDRVCAGKHPDCCLAAWLCRRRRRLPPPPLVPPKCCAMLPTAGYLALHHHVASMHMGALVMLVPPCS